MGREVCGGEESPRPWLSRMTVAEVRQVRANRDRTYWADFCERLGGAADVSLERMWKVERAREKRREWF